MSEGPRPVHDPFLSIYQSAAAEAARRGAASRVADEPARMRSAGLRAAPTKVGSIVEAADTVANARYASAHAGDSAVPVDRAPVVARSLGLGGTARACAELGLRYVEARLSGDQARLGLVEEEFRAGTCDPAWATTLEEYMAYFGPGGSRREIPYVRPEAAGEDTIGIKAGARIALVSDWGTGAESAKRILRQMAALEPDIFIHLGDIYYSGTPTECEVNFTAIIESELRSRLPGLPVYALAGNHDMYCGGVGYYDMIGRLNTDAARQRASFFCLRSEDQGWQLLAMDTGLHDYSPLAVAEAVTHLEAAEVAWLRRRVGEFRGRTILLSHHQLFSAFSRIGKPGGNGVASPCNPHLLAAYGELRAEGEIAAWFWGHEHNLCIYRPFAGLRRGRCIGHGAVPVFANEKIYEPIEGLSSVPELMPESQLAKSGNVYAHGFAVVTLGVDGQPGRADYYQDLDGQARLVLAEALD